MSLAVQKYGNYGASNIYSSENERLLLYSSKADVQMMVGLEIEITMHKYCWT